MRGAEPEERPALDRLLEIVGSNSDVLWDIDLKTQTVWWSDGLRALFGHGPGEVGNSAAWWRAHIHPDDRSRIIESMDTAVRDGSVHWEGEFRYRKADGAYLEVHDRGAITRDIHGEALRFVGMMQDVTARNAKAAIQRLVSGEMAHRAANMVAVITGLFQLTLRGSADLEQLATAFNGRLLAVAAANTAILRSMGEGVDLADLVEVQLAPFAGEGRLTVEGPKVLLDEALGRPIALALNELATNALKYGSLSGEEEIVALRWQVSGEGEARRLVLSWVESGGPVVTPPTRSGLGSTLIERGIGGARVSRTFDPAGFHCRIELAL